MFLLLMFCYKTPLEYEILEVWLSEKKHQRHTVQAGLCYHSRTYSLTLAVFSCHQYKSTAGYLQYLCQLLARLQLQRSLVETLVRSPQLLCLFLQRTLEKKALQASLVLCHRQHLKEGIHKKQMASEAKSKFSTGTMRRFQEIQARTWRKHGSHETVPAGQTGPAHSVCWDPVGTLRTSSPPLRRVRKAEVV